MADTQDNSASDQYLQVLRDREADAEARLEAFEGMLSLTHGWWGNGSLTAFALGFALAQARRLTHASGRVDAIDWEEAALESLELLFQNTHRIAAENPSSWLRGVIRHKLQQQARKLHAEHWAQQITEQMPSPDAEGSEETDQETTGHSQFYSDLFKALAGLPPALREVAQMSLLDRYSPDEIQRTLGITSFTLRKRMQRIRERVAASMATWRPGHR